MFCGPKIANNAIIGASHNVSHVASERTKWRALGGV
jgi:hypothetical protein